jgi:hypothetical protein
MLQLYNCYQNENWFSELHMIFLTAYPKVKYIQHCATGGWVEWWFFFQREMGAVLRTSGSRVRRGVTWRTAMAYHYRKTHYDLSNIKLELYCFLVLEFRIVTTGPLRSMPSCIAICWTPWAWPRPFIHSEFSRVPTHRHGFIHPFTSRTFFFRTSRDAPSCFFGLIRSWISMARSIACSYSVSFPHG